MAEHQIGAQASVTAAHRLHCSEERGIFPGKGSNPCPLHWQVDSYLLYHQEVPSGDVFKSLNAVQTFLSRFAFSEGKVS